MPRQNGNVLVNGFINGLISDATALNSPENSVTECSNVIFDETGKVHRRAGFDYEPNYVLKAIENAGAVTTSYIWKEVNGDGEQNLLVVQVGGSLYFYDLSETILSASAFTDTVALTSHDVSGATDIETKYCQFSSGLGKLIVTHPLCEPFIVTADLSDKATGITSASITVEVRDLIGKTFSEAIDERPTSTVGAAAVSYIYNLHNQGWGYNSATHLAAWDTARSDLPSNADVWWMFRDTDVATFDVTTIPERSAGNTQAPKGHFILNAWTSDRDTASGLSSVGDYDVGVNRPSTCAFFSGRAFYAGVKYTGYLTRIYYSQLMQDTTQAGYCYATNDPTSEQLRDLLPTDGGYIDIQGMGTVQALREMGNALLVFCNNGIWAITGSDGIGFSATNHAVTKVSSIPVTNHTSLVDIESGWSWWNDEGIYLIQRTQQSEFDVQSLTDNKIRNYILENIPSLSRKQVVGAYNPSDRTVQWLWRSTEAADPMQQSQFDKVLCLNTLTGAFYNWDIANTGDSDVSMHAPFVFKGFPGDADVLDVNITSTAVVNGAVSGSDTFVVDGNVGTIYVGMTVSGTGLAGTETVATVVDQQNFTLSTSETVSNDVVLTFTSVIEDSNTDQVISYEVLGSSGTAVFKYLVSQDDTGQAYTIGTKVNELYIDWARFDDGTNYDSTFITNHMVPTDALSFAQTMYTIVYLNTVSGSGGKVQALWDWTNTGDSGRWSTLQTLYPALLPLTGEVLRRDVNYRRLKLRGKGRSLRLRFESEDGKPFNIIGWALRMSSNADV